MADSKAQPYYFDLGNLTCNDPNPLPSLKRKAPTSDKETVLAGTARDCAQALINQLLTACPITRSEDSDGALQISLPAGTTELPREKPVPKEKEKTKWEKFAAKKGIAPKKREGKLVFDEASKEWVPRYGYKGKKVDGGDWLVEVDEKKEKQDGGADGEGKDGSRKKAKKAR